MISISFYRKKEHNSLFFTAANIKVFEMKNKNGDFFKLIYTKRRDESYAPRLFKCFGCD